MKRFVQLASIGLCLGFGLPAIANDGASLYMTKGCIGCHGAEGIAPVAPTYPKIGMQNKEYTINQLKDFKSSARNNGMAALMLGMVAGLTDDDIEKIADYLANVKAGDKK